MREASMVCLWVCAACGSSGLHDDGDAGGPLGDLAGSDLSGPADGGGVDGGSSEPDLLRPSQDLSPLLVALGGHVVVAAPGSSSQPIAGATVQVLGASQANQTTTTSDGSYTLMVPAGGTLFLGGSADLYVNSTVGVVVPIAGATADLKLVPVTVFSNVITSLSPPLNADPTKGHIVVNFNNTNHAGGYGATPSASHGASFTLVSGGTPMYSGTTVQDGDSTLIFPNVDVGATTIALTAPAAKSCTLQQAITNWRVESGRLLFVDAACL
jgi:hypothetical protein